jgi:hypothetical protein
VLVEIFRGIAKLDAIVEPLEDGCEIMFEETVDVPSESISPWIPPKEELEAFRAPSLGALRPSRPNYASRETLRMVEEMLAEDKPESR